MPAGEGLGPGLRAFDPAGGREGKLEHKSSDRCRIGQSSAESLGQSIQKPGREFLSGRIGYKRLTCSAFGRLAPSAILHLSILH